MIFDLTSLLVLNTKRNNLRLELCLSMDTNTVRKDKCINEKSNEPYDAVDILYFVP